MDVVASIQNAIVIAGKLRALSKKIEDADFKMLLADLSHDLADARLEAANLKLEISKLTEQNGSLQQQLAARSTQKPKVAEGAYVFTDDDGHFCTACYDVRHQRVRLARVPQGFDDLATWQCPVCGAVT